jgi:hypothetical protein
MSTTNFPYGIAAPGIVQAVATSPLLPPQGTTGTIFTITGGPILVEQIFGIVRTVIGAHANATKLQYLADNPVLTAVDLCATADINALAAGAIFSLTGTLATGAIIVSPNTNQLALGQATKWNLGTGVIRVNCVGSSVTGAIQWFMMYRPYINATPLDPSAVLNSAGGNIVSVVTAIG